MTLQLCMPSYGTCTCYSPGLVIFSCGLIVYNTGNEFLTIPTFYLHVSDPEVPEYQSDEGPLVISLRMQTLKDITSFLYPCHCGFQINRCIVLRIIQHFISRAM